MSIIKKKKLKLPIYSQFNITIIIADDLTQEVVNITKEPSDIKYNGVFFYKKNGTDLYIGFEKDDLKPGLVAHECLHATCYILDFVQIPLTESSEEAYTYLVGYLVDEVYKLI